MVGDRSARWRWRGSLRGTLFVACLTSGAGVVLGEPPATPDDTPPRYAGKPLTEALLDLQSRGLKIVFTSSVVRPDMVVAAEPVATEPRQALEELLAPHGLESQEGAGGTIVVVPKSEDSPASRSSITGYVRSQRNSAPVSGATVRVLETGVEVGSLADGSFTIPDPGVGRLTLEARRSGYVGGARASVLVTAGEPSEDVTIFLVPMTVLEDELIVTPSRVSLLRDEPMAPFALGRDEILALPHLGNDFFRALSLLPGTAANDVSAQIHVRGGRRDETQILLDGQEIYEAYHLKDFDNALSVVVAETVDSVDLTTGGFSVRYGDRMSGVLDMTTTTPTGSPRFRIGASILNAHAGVAGGFGNRRGSYLGQLRRGSTDLTRRIFGEERPTFWDAFGKLDYQLNSQNSLRANLLNSNDEFELDEVKPDERRHIETDYNHGYVWLTHQSILGGNLFFETAASLSRVDRDRNGEELEEDARFVVRDLRDLEVRGLRQSWNFQPASRHYLRWGFELRAFDTEYDYFNTTSFDNLLGEIRNATDADTTVFRNRFEEHHTSLFVADRLRPRQPLTLELGLRYDRHSQTSESHLTPRFNLAYALGNRSVLRVAWGRFNQSQRPYELQVEDGETAFAPVERSEHRIIGYERLFEAVGKTSDLALRIELYQREVGNPRPRYENLYEPLNNFPEAEPDRVRIAPERSVAEGFEIFLRGRLGRRANWWMNYTYSSTDDRIAGDWVPREFDQTHSINLDFDYRFAEEWRLNLAWRYHTGWPTTPVSVTESEGEEGETEFVPVLGPLNSDRLSHYHRLDLRASRLWRLRAGVLIFFIDIQNVYDRKNLAGFDIEIDGEDGSIVTEREAGVGFLPSIGISFEF